MVAFWVSLACVLQIAESLIPHPLPGIRLGLANMVTLVVLVNVGFRTAVQVAILRTIVSSLILGTFMSPSFILSFSGALISALVMGFFYLLSTINQRLSFSLIGISILGALSHNLTQLNLAYLLLIKHRGMFMFLPWLSISAVVTGWITGLIASQVCRKLKSLPGEELTLKDIPEIASPLKAKFYSERKSFLHSLRPEIKIMGVIIFALTILFLKHFWFYLLIFASLLLTILLSKTSLRALFSRITQLSSFIFISFALPVLFHSGGKVLSHWGPLKITEEGLTTGGLFAFRIILLALIASLLMRTTSPEEMTLGLRRVLSPLKIFGLSGNKIARVVTLSWLWIPLFWEEARGAIRDSKIKEARKLRNLIPLLSDLLVTLFRRVEGRIKGACPHE